MIWLLLVLVVQAKIDMQIGAGGVGFGCGSNSPAAQLPYSFVRLGPDTAPQLKKQYFKFQHFGGYNTADHYLRAFSHLHLVGAGIQDMGIFGVLPLPARGSLSPPQDPLALFFKDSQMSEPGYYSVTLEDGSTAELTTTQRAGLHRYSLKGHKSYRINVMTGYLLDKAGKRISSTARCGSHCLQGSITVFSGFGGRFGGYSLHFHLEWSSSDQDKLHLFDDSGFKQNATETKGNWTGSVIQTNSSNFQIYIGISYVSRENAKVNLYTEVPQRDFAAVRQAAKQRWKQQFDRFEVSAVNQEFQTKWDTALYRTLLTPTLFSDFNREYPSFKNDGSVSKVPDDMEGVYTDMSLWDVHRSQMPWILFHDPLRFSDVAKSLLLINKEGGYMPKWPFAQGWTGCMIGAHANTILADWAVKQSLPKETVDSMLGFMVRNANEQTPHDSRPSPQRYKKKGYVAFDDASRSSVSQTVQLSFNDYGISQVAALANQPSIQKDFLNRSSFYKALWNNKTKFFDPRYANGSFFPLPARQRINPLSNYYVQGDAWHYRFAVPHDPEGLIELFGGNTPFLKELTRFLSRSQFWPTFWLPNPYYWAGNEHNLFAPWLFSFAGRSDLTAKYTRMIMKSQYGLGGDGLPGNDDYGTMSAWFLWAALGLFPRASTQTYILGSPLVSSARIYRRLPSGLKAFNVFAQGNSARGYQVQSVNLDGALLKGFVSHNELNKQNAVLTFVMAQP